MLDHPFDADTRVEPAGEHTYRAALTDRWNALGGVPNGGFVRAIATFADHAFWLRFRDGREADSPRWSTPPRRRCSRPARWWRSRGRSRSCRGRAAFPGGSGVPAVEGLDRPCAEVLHPLAVQPPRQIYASAADRRSGRRWRRRRHPWVPAALVAGAATVAFAAGEVLRSLG